MYINTLNHDDIDFIQTLPGYDPSYELVHYHSDYFRGGYSWNAIFVKNNKYYAANGGYDAMNENNHETDYSFDAFNIHEISFEEALDSIA